MVFSLSLQSLTVYQLDSSYRSFILLWYAFNVQYPINFWETWIIHFPFGTDGNWMFLDVPISKHIRVCHMIILFSAIVIYLTFNLIIIVVLLPVSFNTSILFFFYGGRGVGVVHRWHDVDPDQTEKPSHAWEMCSYIPS